MSDLIVWGGAASDGTPLDVAIADGLIAESSGGATFDATGLTVVPGLIDLQVNGGIGVDFTAEPTRLWEVAAELPRFGVTAFVPTVITSSPEARETALATLAGGPPDGWAGAIPLGLHFEGPMIAPARKGAHPAQWLVPPSSDVVAGWTREAGVLVVTIAPELPGALEVIRTLVANDVIVSVGHTEATAGQVLDAVAAGARLTTHLGNAMEPFLAREPGPIGAALGGDELVAGLITDGFHLDALFVSAAWRGLGPDRFLTVTDTTAALGLPDGMSRLGDQHVIVADGTVRLADGTLAGSAASLPQCLRFLMSSTGCSLPEAIGTVTATPARVVGDAARGTLTPGARGDLTLLDDDLEVVATVVAGTVVYGEFR